MPHTNTDEKLDSPAKILREHIRTLERQLGMLSTAQTCCNVTMSQCHAIVEIGRHAPLTLGELSDILKLDKSTMSRTVNQLVKKNLVSRHIDETDRRYVTLNLTEPGYDHFKTIENDMNTYFERLFINFPLNERETIIKSLSLLTKAIDLTEEESKTCCSASLD